MLNERPSDSLIQRALNNGCAGVITAKESVNEIIDAISAVKSGRNYFSPELSQRIITNRNNNESDFTSRKSLLVAIAEATLLYFVLNCLIIS